VTGRRADLVLLAAVVLFVLAAAVAAVALDVWLWGTP